MRFLCFGSLLFDQNAMQLLSVTLCVDISCMYCMSKSSKAQGSICFF